MFQTIRNAFKIEDLRKKIIFTFLMMIVIRFGSQLPVPGANVLLFQSYLDSLRDSAGGAFCLFDAMTGGSFENLAVFALSITPYITSSIIMQLLTIAIPILEEIHNDG